MGDLGAPLRRVLAVTPLGAGGAGGIDRMMDALRPRAAEFACEGFAVAYCASRGAGSLAMSPLYLAATIGRVAGAALGRGPDLAHINLSSHGSALRKLAISATARRVGLPYVLHLHGSRFQSYFDAAGPGLRAAIAGMFEGAARVVVLGAVWRDWVRDRAPAARIDILPNAVAAPSDLVPRQDGRIHILFLGRIGPRKGADELLRALAMLPRGPWRATLAGDGDVVGARDLVARLGLGGAVSAPGWVDPDGVRALLADCDIVALPSHQENLPLSLIEGMAYGRALIGTPVGAVADIVRPGETGLLVPPGDAAALAAALSALMADPHLRARLGEGAMRLHRERFDLDGYVKRLAAVWRLALDGPQG